MLDVLRTLFRTAFTDLSFFKRWLLRLALVGLVGGAGWKFFGSSAPAGGIDWAALALRVGAGCLGGFVVGASVRIFLKVTIAVGIGLIALGWLLQKIGWVDLPWHSFGDAWEDVRLAVSRQTGAVKDFLSGYLPAGGATALGTGAGLTQRPQFDDDTD